VSSGAARGRASLRTTASETAVSRIEREADLRGKDPIGGKWGVRCGGGGLGGDDDDGQVQIQAVLKSMQEMGNGGGGGGYTD